jgi:hypothetical protein
MQKVVAGHQPNYLPWIGLFSKISKSDFFIVGDIFSVGRKSSFSRNKVRTNSGWGYLTVPVGGKVMGKRICEIAAPSDKAWQKIHWETIHKNYAHTNYFKDHKDFFEETYRKDYTSLCQMNLDIILYLMTCFDIHVEVIRASEMALDSSLPITELIIAMVKGAGGDTYLSGPSGKDYLRFEKFSHLGIGLNFFRFDHPVYKQRYSGFEPFMSAIDLLFNTGPQAARIIKTSGAVEAPFVSLSRGP